MYTYYIKEKRIYPHVSQIVLFIYWIDLVSKRTAGGTNMICNSSNQILSLSPIALVTLSAKITLLPHNTTSSINSLVLVILFHFSLDSSDY